MLALSILFALGLPQGNDKGLDVPGWVGYIFYPLAVAGIWYALRKKAEKDVHDNDDKHDE